MADYRVISDVSTSLAMLLDQGPSKPPLTEGNDHADEVQASLSHFGSNGPVTSAPDHADSHLRRTR